MNMTFNAQDDAFLGAEYQEQSIALFPRCEVASSLHSLGPQYDFSLSFPYCFLLVTDNTPRLVREPYYRDLSSVHELQT